MKLNLSEFLFLIWAAGVMLFWSFSTPDSAPQQAALAGQALVLICIPYCVLSVLQRSRAARAADGKPVTSEEPLVLSNAVKRP